MGGSPELTCRLITGATFARTCAAGARLAEARSVNTSSTHPLSSILLFFGLSSSSTTPSLFRPPLTLRRPSMSDAFDKEAALESDHGSATPAGAVDLNAQRRAALAEIDNVR